MPERYSSAEVASCLASVVGANARLRRRWKSQALALLLLGSVTFGAPAVPAAASSRQLSAGHAFSDIRLTTADPKFSSNGQFAVYQQDAVTDGAFELWSVRVDGTTPPVRLSGVLTPAQGTYMSFEISPDDTRVVYLADQDTQNKYELFSVPIQGGVSTKLNLSLSADRNVVFFQISPNGSGVFYRADPNFLSRWELFSVPIDGGNSVRLNAALPFDNVVADFAVSPNGMTVIYRAGRTVTGLWELFTVAAGGGDATKISLPLPVGGGVRSDYLISPNGTRVVYTADAPVNGTYDLYSVPIDGGTSTKLNTAPASGLPVASNFVISANNSRVVFRAGSLQTQIFNLFSVPIGGGSVTQLNGLLGAGESVATGFAISADSSKVVYRSDEDADTVDELHSVPLAGGTLTKLNGALVSGGDVLGSPSFSDFLISPDSTRVVYLADQNVDTLNELFSVPIGGGSATKLNRQLASGGDVQAFRISPDSDWVVYGADQDADTVDELLRVPIAGGTVQPVNGPLVFGGDVVLKNGQDTVFEIFPNSIDVLYAADENVNDEFELYLGSEAAVPGAPTAVSGVPGNAQVSVSFLEPNSGGSPILYYTVTWTSTPPTPGGQDSNVGTANVPHVITGLTNGVAYTFTVTATNANGTSALSVPSVPVTPRTVPGAPSGVSATAWNESAVVTFLAPSSNGGSPILYYTVTWTSTPPASGGRDLDAGTASLTHHIAELANGTEYQFRVRATNAAGQGPLSDLSSPVTPSCIFCSDFEQGLQGYPSSWTNQPSLSVLKTVSPSALHTPNQTVSFNIVVTNTGFFTLTGVTVSDLTAILDDCSPAQPATLLPGEQMNCPATHVVTNTDLILGAYTNTAIADSVETTEPSDDSVTVEFSSDLGITIAHGEGVVMPGDVITYTIIASNAGPFAAPAATVIDIFPVECENPTWTCGGTGGGSCSTSGSGVILQAVNLPVGGSVEFQAECTVSLSATGVLANSATISFGENDPIPGDNSATDLILLDISPP